MNVLNAILDHPAILQWGWVLAHFLWQGTLLALFAWLLLLCTSRNSARVRYILSTGCLFVAVVCPIVTWISLDAPASPIEALSESRTPVAASERISRERSLTDASEISRQQTNGQTSGSFVAEIPIEEPVESDATIPIPTPVVERELKARLETWLPWCVAFRVSSCCRFGWREAGTSREGSSPTALRYAKSG